MQWEYNIGLEVHVQLDTKTKLFSSSPTQYGALPNTQICEIDAGLPGILPVLNQEAVKMAIKFGLATNAIINQDSYFERKNYFYPDLPKGYQISQNKKPIIEGGEIKVASNDNTEKIIKIHHAHLEEDAGKSNHELYKQHTAIDLNRTGNPLLEIVTTPYLTNAKEAVSFLRTLHTLVRALKISNANMQEGSFRCDANISVRPKGKTELGIKTEIKNMNSFKFIEHAINYEISRHIELLESNQTVVQETRLYCAQSNSTRSMRSKENALDYRYFPEPDLPPVYITADLIDDLQRTMPELPDTKKERFIKSYQLKTQDAEQITGSLTLCEYFEAVIEKSTISPVLAAKWLLSKLLGACNKNKLDVQQSPIAPQQLQTLLLKVQDNTLSEPMAKKIFDLLWDSPSNSVENIIESTGLKKIANTQSIDPIIDAVLTDNPKQVLDYKNGKTKLFGFFIGQIMKATKGQADPKVINELLKNKLSN